MALGPILLGAESTRHGTCPGDMLAMESAGGAGDALRRCRCSLPRPHPRRATARPSYARARCHVDSDTRKPGRGVWKPETDPRGKWPVAWQPSDLHAGARTILCLTLICFSQIGQLVWTSALPTQVGHFPPALRRTDCAELPATAAKLEKPPKQSRRAIPCHDETPPMQTADGVSFLAHCFSRCDLR